MTHVEKVSITFLLSLSLFDVEETRFLRPLSLSTSSSSRSLCQSARHRARALPSSRADIGQT